MEPLNYAILGPLQVHRGDEPVAVGSGKQAELLALLLTQRNAAVSTDRLIDELWDGRPPDTAAKIVQNAVSGLRRAFGDESGEVLVTQGRGYMLAAGAGATDIDQAEELLERGRAQLADGRAADAAHTLRSALGLWRGAPLPEIAYRPFARDEIARVEELRLVVLEDRIDADLATGEGASLVPELEQLLAREPLRERVRGQLMLALYRAGRQARALEVYGEGRRVLSEQLGIEPGEQLKRLERAILEHDPELDSLRPARVPLPRSRRGQALIAAGGACLVLAALAAVLFGRAGTTHRLDMVPGNAIGLVDTSTGRIIAEYPVGQVPVRVVASKGVAWTLNAGDHTVSRVDLRNGGAPLVAHLTGREASDIVLGGGWVWVSVIDRKTGASTLVRVDEKTMRQVGTVALPGPVDQFETTPLAYGAGLVWAGTPSAVVGVDPLTRHITTRIPATSPTAVAYGDGQVFVASENGPPLTAFDPSGGSRRELEGPGSGPIITTGGVLWAADRLTGDVWRIDSHGPDRSRSVSVGVSVAGMTPDATGTGVLAVSGIDGTMTRITSLGADLATQTFGVGNTPTAVSVDGANAIVAVDEGGGAPDQTGSALAGVKGVQCGRLVRGATAPRYLIAADLALSGPLAEATLPMRQAIVYRLRAHGFMAGSQPVALQVCDDGRHETFPTDVTCSANARLYAGTPDVIGVIGPFNSDCAKSELAILNRAGLATVSPSTSSPGLTHAGPGTLRGEPAVYQPTGRPNFVRVIPTDDMQGTALATLAGRLGLRHVYVFQLPDIYGDVFSGGFERAAQSAGIKVTDSLHVAPSNALGNRRLASAYDGAVVAGPLSAETFRFMRFARKAGGRRILLLGGSQLVSGVDASDLVQGARGAEAGMYIAFEGVSDPLSQLHAAGTRFAVAFAATQPSGDVTFYAPYTAQATDVMLSAIARSDGTRASVTRALLQTRIRNGILGTFSFNRAGDMTPNLLPILRVGTPDDPSALRVYDVIHLSPPAPTR